MTITELESTLPNGFHDAYLHSYYVNLVDCRAELRIELSVGSPSAPTEEEREAYRAATLTLEGLLYFVVEPPDPRYRCKPPWRIDLCEADPGIFPSGELPMGACRFYSAETNAFIHFAASSAHLSYA